MRNRASALAEAEEGNGVRVRSAFAGVPGLASADTSPLCCVVVSSPSPPNSEPNHVPSITKGFSAAASASRRLLVRDLLYAEAITLACLSVGSTLACRAISSAWIAASRICASASFSDSFSCISRADGGGLSLCGVCAEGRAATLTVTLGLREKRELPGVDDLLFSAELFAVRETGPLGLDVVVAWPDWKEPPSSGV
jgi:hypothetical protein